MIDSPSELVYALSLPAMIVAILAALMQLFPRRKPTIFDGRGNLSAHGRLRVWRKVEVALICVAMGLLIAGSLLSK